MGAILGGLLLAVGGALGWVNINLPGEESDSHWVTHAVSTATAIGILPALAAVHAAQANRDRFERFGFLLAWYGIALSVLIDAVLIVTLLISGRSASTYDFLHAAGNVPFFLGYAGLIAFAVGTIRLRVMPRAPSILLLLGSLGGPITSLLLGIAWIWLGIYLLRMPNTPRPAT